MTNRSIEGRLNTTLLAGTGLLLLLAGVALERLVTAGIQREYDAALEAKARALVGLSEQSRGRVEVDFTLEAMPEFGRGSEPSYFELWFAERASPFGRSPSLVGGDLERAPGASAIPRFRHVVLADGRPGRQVQLDYVPAVEAEDPDDEEDEEEEEGIRTPVEGASDMPRSVTLVVARGTGEMDATLRIFRVSLGAVALLLLAAIAALVRQATRRSLAPLSDIAREVGELKAQMLDRRISTPVAAAELVPLVHTLNDLLARLQEAFERERRLSSDIAHELRTPVAELRTLAEVGRRWPDDRGAVVGFLDDAHAIALHMEEVIESLLSLSRCEAGLETVVREPLELRAAVERSWAHVAERARARGVILRFEGPESVTASTDGKKLALMLGALLANAAEHGPEGSEVVCSLRDGVSPEIAISNPAPHLQRSDLPVMFERFWRKDPARSGGSHAGLGLAIVRALADLLSIRLAPVLSDDGRLTVSLSIPALR